MGSNHFFFVANDNESYQMIQISDQCLPAHSCQSCVQLPIKQNIIASHSGFRKFALLI